MSAVALQSYPLSVEEYVAGEEHSPVKHEYLDGTPHAMASASIRHIRLAANLNGLLFVRLNGRRCEPVGSDMKLKIQTPTATFFYYPDAMVLCASAKLGRSWCENPTVIFEILSESTRATDEREKSVNYKAIPSLDAYVRIEQKMRRVVIERRTPSGWASEELTAPESILSLPTIAVEFPLAELYQRLEFPPLPDEPALE